MKIEVTSGLIENLKAKNQRTRCQEPSANNVRERERERDSYIKNSVERKRVYQGDKKRRQEVERPREKGGKTARLYFFFLCGGHIILNY